MHHLNAGAGTLTLMGSGEMTPGMARVHRQIMSRIEGPVRAVFIDTPAGFELNVAGIAQKAVDYFREHFGLELKVASFLNASATPVAMEQAMRTLRQANYLFSGPGSPTYAVRQWRNTPIFETMAAKLAAGSHLVLASAATLAMGRYTIPVYEIYKVGEDPHWVEGLDLLGRYGLDLAIVPHWNNTSGMSHDTTRAFIGQPRFEQLVAMLPASTTILGIDEYTACILDPAQKRGEVIGAGTVTIRRGESEQVLPSGERFSFDLLQAPAGASTALPSLSPPDPAALLIAQADETYEAFRQALGQERYPASAIGYVHGLMESIRRAREAGVPASRRAQVEVMLREMLAALAIWLEEHPVRIESEAAATPAIETLLELVVDIRTELRAAKAWALADRIRAALAELGVVLEDTPEGTHWHLPRAGSRTDGWGGDSPEL